MSRIIKRDLRLVDARPWFIEINITKSRDFYRVQNTLDSLGVENILIRPFNFRVKRNIFSTTSILCIIRIISKETSYRNFNIS